MLAPTRKGRLLNLRTAHWLAFLVPAGLLAGAIGSQLLGGLYPCEMCIWQRWPHALALVAAILAAVIRSARVPLVALAGLAIAVSGAIGVYHAGVELDVFEGLTTCSTGGGAASLDDIFATPIVRCDAVQWSFLGISMAGWNAIISLGTALLIAIGLRKGTAR